MSQITHSFPLNPGDGQLYPSESIPGGVQYKYSLEFGSWLRVPQVPVVERIDAKIIRSGTLDRNRLPSTGISSGTYTNIASISVNEKGQVTSIVETT